MTARGGNAHGRHDASTGARPLDRGLRRLLEDSFDHDLSDVLVVRGGRADHVCRRFGADGCATGRTVFLRSTGPGARSKRGVWLLAHEVAHVVQQRRGAVAAVPIGRGRAVGLPGGPHEHEADAAADAALSGTRHTWAPAPPPPRRAIAVWQLHVSHEHQLIGDTDIDSMAHLAGLSSAERQRVLLTHRDLVREWGTSPEDLSEEYITARAPWLKVVRMPNGVVMTYGELNALADFLPNARSVLDFPRDALLSLLQTIREESYLKLSELAHLPAEEAAFPKSVHSPRGLFRWRNIAGLIASASSPAHDHLAPLLCRNGGHFAPQSWYRWARYHNAALDFADEASRSSGQAKDDLAALAWTYNGYADHFLQDSFAAGHLIPKALPMQWALENRGRVLVWRKLRDPLAAMTEQRQPGLSGRHLYGPYRANLSSNDPQTVDESGLPMAERVARLGLDAAKDGPEQTYRNFLGFLGNPALQMETMRIHDWYNATNVEVASEDRENPYWIGGDESLIQKGPGLEILKATCDLSRASVSAALDGKGDQRAVTARIFAMFPSRVKYSGEIIPLATWVDREVKSTAQFLRRLPENRLVEIFGAVQVRDVMSDASPVRGSHSEGFKPAPGPLEPKSKRSPKRPRRSASAKEIGRTPPTNAAPQRSQRQDRGFARRLGE